MSTDTAFHMPGKHNQAEHGHGSGKRLSESHKATLRSANKPGGTKKGLGSSAGGRQRNADIDDLHSRGFLEKRGDSYHTTQKGKDAIDDTQSFDPGTKTAGETVPFVVVSLTSAGPPVTGGSSDYTVTGGTPFDGVLAVEGTKTGDGRMFSENAISWIDPLRDVMPLRWNIEDSHGGQPTTKAVNVGRITRVWRDPVNPLLIRGSGVFDDGENSDNEYAKMAARRVSEGFLSGVSIDPDDITESDIELVFPENDGAADGDIMSMFAMPELTVFHAGRIRAATLVDIPAFVEAKIRISQGQEDAVAASSHFDVVSDSSWNGAANERRLPSRMSAVVARTAFAHVDHGDGRASARFLHHEIGEDGDVGSANLTACISGIRMINSGQSLTGIPFSELRAAYEHMAQHLRSAGLTPPEFSSDEPLVASSVLTAPPIEWFANPNFTELTPLTITEDGRVYGHGAAWESCHMGFGGTCVTPPAEPGGEHMYFRLGEVVTAEGHRVPVGSITLGTGHAPVRNISASQAAEHYDNTGTAVAFVASGEDDFGIWVAGAIRPGTPENRIIELRGASLSGDWRRIGGALRLVAFLAVNRPGFPIPRRAAFASKNAPLSLVASGIVPQDVRQRQTHAAGVDAAIARIARGIGLDPESKLAALRRRMGRE